MDSTAVKHLLSGMFVGFAIYVLGFLASGALRDRHEPAPAPAAAVVKSCDGSCRPASPSFRPFDVVCPHCSNRFRVVPSTSNPTGAVKNPIGKSTSNRGGSRLDRLFRALFCDTSHRPPWFA